MENYMVVSTIEGKDYLSKVTANSLYGAEHAVLDLSYTGKSSYGVTGCQAFGMDEMRTDFFIGRILHAEPVSFEELNKIIIKRNKELKIEDIQREIASKQKELEILNSELESI